MSFAFRVNRFILLWKDVGNSRKVSAAGVKVGSLIPPLRKVTCVHQSLYSQNKWRERQSLNSSGVVCALGTGGTS